MSISELNNNKEPQMNKKVLIGRILAAIPILVLAMSAFMKLQRGPEVMQGIRAQGISESLLTTIMILEILSLVLYAIPQTAVIGAILVTGYMGGAIMTHLRLGDGVAIQVMLPIIAWLSLYLRDERLRHLLPLRK
jgi:hypothetical protein